MYSFKQYQSACIGVAVFIGMLGLLVPHASYGAPATKDVNVVNTPNVNVTNDETSPVPVTIKGGAQSLTEYRVVGFTAPTDGFIETVDQSLSGIGAMHSLCAEVASNARAAFSDEAMRSPPIVGGPFVAWVIPSQPQLVFRPDAASAPFDWIAVDQASGAGAENGDAGLQVNPESAIAVFACSWYQNNSTSEIGFVWNGQGRITGSLCSIAKPIACSAPVAVPISP